MNKKLIVATLLICLVSLMVIQTARAQTAVTPGVQQGEDYFYHTFSYWTSSNAYSSIPQDLVTTNQTQAIEVRISDVNDTYITTFTATYYTSGNPTADRGALNIQTGAVTDEPFPAIIGANLTAGNLIHPLGTDGITINYTVSMNGRQTNEIYITEYNSSTGLTDSVDRYFDQQTGMLVKEVDSEIDDGSVSSYTGTNTLTTVIASSPWNPQTVLIATASPSGSSNPTTNPVGTNSGWTYALVVAVVIVVVVLVALLLLRKRQNSGRRRRYKNVRFEPPPPPP